jgi:hypothetical protein
MLSQAKRDVQLSRLRWLIAVENCRSVIRRIGRQHKYDPNQPRVPAGNSDGGQWTGDASGSSSRDLTATDRQVILAASRGGGIPRALWNLTVRQFVSRYCRGSINRELPGQFDDVTIADILDIAKGGDEAARKCYKLLNQPRFRK